MATPLSFSRSGSANMPEVSWSEAEGVLKVSGDYTLGSEMYLNEEFGFVGREIVEEFREATVRIHFDFRTIKSGGLADVREFLLLIVKSALAKKDKRIIVEWKLDDSSSISSQNGARLMAAVVDKMAESFGSGIIEFHVALEGEGNTSLF